MCRDIISITMTDSELRVILLPAFRHYCGMHRRKILLDVQHKYWDETADKRCWICGRWVQRYNRSIDHLVPIKICMLLNLDGLVFDKRNFRIAHTRCNSYRHHDISKLPPAIIAKLETMGYTENN